MTIVDQWGRPFTEDVTRTPQTAGMAYMPNMWADLLGETLTPAQVLRILRESRNAYMGQQSAMYRQFEERDPFLFGEMLKRKNAIGSREMTVEPPEEPTAAESEAADFMAEYVTAIDLSGHLFDAGEAIGHGFQAFELMDWGLIEGVRAPRQLTPRPHEWFRLKQYQGTMASAPAMDRTDLRLLDGSALGAELMPFGWWVHVHRSLSGGLHRAGLFRVVAFIFLYKHFAQRDFAELLEIYGVPPRIGKFDPNNVTPRDKAALYKAIQSLGHDAAGIIPASMQIELLTAAGGETDAFSRMIDICNAEYAKAVNGKDPQNKGGLGGGNGQQEVGNQDVREDINIADCRQLANSFTNDVLWPIAALNFGITDIRRCPRLKFNTQRVADRKTMGEAFQALQLAGIKIPAKWAADQAQIPEPQDDEELLQAPAPAAPPVPGSPNSPSPGQGAEPGKPGVGGTSKDDAVDLPGENDAAEAKAMNKGAATLTALLLSALAATPAPNRDGLDDLTDHMLDGWRPVMDDALAPLRDAVAEAAAKGESLASLQARLPDLLEKMDVDGLAKQLAQGQFAARLAGVAGLLDPAKPKRG